MFLFVEGVGSLEGEGGVTDMSYDPGKLYHLMSRGFIGQNLYDHNYGITRNMYDLIDIISGYRAYQDTVAKNQVQIDYDQYMKQGYERKLADWHKGFPNREIKYPELAMAGSIAGYNAGISGANYSNDIAASNYAGNALYRGMGLYNVFSRASRFL